MPLEFWIVITKTHIKGSTCVSYNLVEKQLVAQLQAQIKCAHETFAPISPSKEKGTEQRRRNAIHK